jgi:tetratricopeptide (TPR) repeat protein
MIYHSSKKSPHNKHLTNRWIKIAIYIALIVGIAIYWFVTAQKAISLKQSLIMQAEYERNNLQDIFRKKISQSEKNTIELGILGEQMIQKGHIAYGMLILEHATSKDSSIRDLNLYLSKIYYDQQDLHKAKELALLALQCDPIHAPTYLLLYEIYLGLDDDQNANICYDKYNDFSTDK